MTKPAYDPPEWESTVRRVLAEYRVPAASQVEGLGAAGGFSGAMFWRVADSARTWCLRRWPTDHPHPTQLQLIHNVLDHVARQGFALCPLPERTSQGQSFVQAAGHLWELTPWLAGRADFRQSPSPARLKNALQTLARFHLAAASFPLPGPHSAPAPNLIVRLARLHDWRCGRATRLAGAVTAEIWPELAPRAGRILAHFTARAETLEALLKSTTSQAVPLQPCIRDVWHDHLLFCGDAVSGLIDFGALQIDSVAGDLARLLASLAGPDAAVWNAGLEAYQSLRPLSDAERSLLVAFDQSSQLLSGMNWLDWIYLEHREFSDRGVILARIDEILERLHTFSFETARGG